MKFNRVLENIKNYEPGKPIELVMREYGIDESDIVKLASNENPYGTPPKAVKVIKKEAEKAFMYPDDSMSDLKRALGERFSVNNENIVIGAGSDQIIEFAVRAKANENNAVLMAKTTFAMYEIYARETGCEILKTPSNEHKLDEFLDIYEKNREKVEIIFLCLPNNPLGECLDRREVYEFLRKIDKNVLVVVDGAYQEYASYKDSSKKIDPKDLINNFPNALYLGTFSKAYGLGGMRVGYGIAREEIINTLYKLRPPFNVTILSLKAAEAALEDEKFVKKAIKSNFEEMVRYEIFAKERGIKYIESYTNFITFLLDSSKNSSKVAEALLKKGVIVRDLSSYGLNAVRITIGKKKQNDRFFELFEKIYG